MAHTAHARETLIELMGTIITRERSGFFKVKIGDTDRVVSARPAGRMSHHKIKFAAGDNVLIELPIGTLDRARIIYRKSA